MDESRRRQLESRLNAVQQEIAATAAASGRSIDDITLVVVTKTWPTSDTRILYDLGVRDVAENRQQDLERKAGELEDLDLRWHFIGQIQSNKAARIATYADVVHSVDSVKVAARVNAAAGGHGRLLDCFVQVSLDQVSERSRRGGVAGDDISAIAEALESGEALRLRGVMGVAPLHGDPATAYRELAAASRRLQRLHPSATAISAGMSGDFPTALRAGATHVRVGSAVLGQRPPLR